MMRDRFRNFDSKISFFAFADIITAICGVLIFITLLLATDLAGPTAQAKRATDTELQRRLAETLREQADLDTQNRKLQELLTSAETAPGPDKLNTDIARLRLQLTEEKRKHTAVTEQLAASQSAIEARDGTLGLTDRRAQIQRIIQESESLARDEAKVRDEMVRLDQRVAGVQSKLLQLREREGKLWLIPDRSSTTKEPILATISGSGAKVERFDRLDQTKEFNKATARTGFDSYLSEVKPVDQYVVFLVRPSGIELFERLVKVAREKGFEVGFDALEENREIHFTTPPALDETPVPSEAPDSRTESHPPVSNPTVSRATNFVPGTPSVATNPISPPPAASKPAPAPKTKSWWQRVLEFIGLA
jgi:hypothetical protein